MNALVTLEPAPTAGPHGDGHTVFSARRQAEFLQHLQLFGNVRLAARDHAEQVLASRAIDGWEEAVFYHGEEVAPRRRYSDRLLLAPTTPKYRAD